MEKITFASADSQENEEFFVLEQTKLNGVSYILVTDSEEDDAECWILKDTSPEESSEAIYEFVEDEHSTLEHVSGQLKRTENPFINDYKLRLSGNREVI